MHDTTLDNNSQKHVVVAEIPIIDFTEDDEEDVKATLQNGPSLNFLGIPLVIKCHLCHLNIPPWLRQVGWEIIQSN